jgi:LAGLIDADG DNA endonuclease family
LANSLKALKAFKGLLSFPDPLFDITVGLGDLSLGPGLVQDQAAVKRYPNSMAVLKFCQSYKHLDYLIHLYDLFSLYVSSSPRVYEINRSSGSYLQVSFQTLSFPFFDQLYLLFYDPISGKKKVPENIGNLLTPLGLSYWFADDGAKAGLFLHTDGFSKEDVVLLLSVLDSKFGLQCSLRQRHKDQYAIYISAHSKEQFIGLINTFLHPSLHYKLI